MPSTNLDFNVTATTSQARADLKLLQAELREVGRQLNAAVKAGDTAGARTLADTFGRMQTQVVAFKKEINGTTAAMDEFSLASTRTMRSLLSLQGGVASIAQTLGGAKAGFLAFAAVLGANALGKAIDETVKGLEKIQQTAGNTNLKPSEVKAYQEMMLRAGISTDASAASLDTFAKVLQEARIKAGAFGNDLKVNVMRGSEGASSGIIRLSGDTAQFVNVIRGSKPAIKDLSDPLGQLGVNVKTLENGFMGVRIAAAQAVQAMAQVSKERAAGLGAAVFGPDWEKETRALVEFANSPAWAQLKQQTAAIISPEDQKRIDDYNKAWGDLQIAWDGLKTEMVLALFPTISGAINMATEQLRAFIAVWNNFSAIAARTMTPSPSLPFGDPSIPAMPREGVPWTPGLAAGGYIRGPGSGTTDSILARLSNGEFVMRARAVDHWGPRFMAALNSLQNPFGYAGGGLVRPPRFATGGMVTATTADGVTVNLNFPGGSFALRGDREIVGGLTREARRAGMLSAGRMAGALA